MKPYPEYKDSDVKWIGEIPSDWKISRVGEIYTEKKETVSDKDFPPLSVTMDGIKDQLLNVAKTDNHDNRKKVCKDDFVINSRSDRKGSSGISPKDGSVSVINIVMEPNGIHPKFSEWLFKSFYFKEEFFRNGRGIHWDLWSTKYSILKYIRIPFPQFTIQKQISDYLDRKTQQIDDLVEKTERKIVLLKEQRSSLINQCVTKGLDPNVEMKDTGVEWIGEIPKHWKISKVKFELDFHNQTRIPLSAEERGARQGPYPYYGSTSLIDYVDDYLFDGNYILIAEDGANLLFRNLRLSFQVKGKFWVNNHAHILKSKNDGYDGYFCELLEQSDFTTFITGSAQPKLTLNSIKEVPLCVPPNAEISEISQNIELVSSEFSKVIKLHGTRRDLLREYRQSLISNVVTGKIDIRDEVIQ
jgi:type I restriction enzyme S subunit